MRKIKKGDEVVIIAGKDKGQRGKVTKVISCRAKTKAAGEYFKVVVAGFNLVKKHFKSRDPERVKSEIISIEAPLDISNVAIFNPKTGKADRVGFKLLENNAKVRIFKSNGEVIDV